jgi:2-C-methyl-D-erythritol 2,4-cyclodiphosphate synthase
MKYKVGTGYDVHAFCKDKPLIIGGVNIPYSLGLKGHSDADVLIHAIIDALLGAANLRDIGFQYPDNDSNYKNIDSTLLLKDTAQKLKDKNFKIENIDSTIILQTPKISAFIPQMQQRLAQVLELETEDITIKATTTEHLGFCGRGEGVAAQAICLLSDE